MFKNALRDNGFIIYFHFLIMEIALKLLNCE
jgi:hypothetical protein